MLFINATEPAPVPLIRLDFQCQKGFRVWARNL
jgi:hypothetical protein